MQIVLMMWVELLLLIVTELATVVADFLGLTRDLRLQMRRLDLAVVGHASRYLPRLGSSRLWLRDVALY